MPNDNIFLSYSRSDSEIAFKIASELSSNGVNIWVDQINIPVGAIWDYEIEKALEDCDRLIFLLSSSSVSSNNVLNEVSYAIESNKVIIPVKLSDCKIPFRIRRFQFIDLSHSYEKGFHRLLQVLKNNQSKEKQNEDFVHEPKSAIPTLTDTGLKTEQNINKELVTDDKFINNSIEVKKVLFCFGKIYDYLVKEQVEKKRKDVAIIKINQIFPVPTKEIKELHTKYKSAVWFWVQEEPVNLGAAPLLNTTLKSVNFGVIGRQPNVSTSHINKDELNEIIAVSFSV